MVKSRRTLGVARLPVPLHVTPAGAGFAKFRSQVIVLDSVCDRTVAVRNSRLVRINRGLVRRNAMAFYVSVSLWQSETTSRRSPRCLCRRQALLAISIRLPRSLDVSQGLVAWPSWSIEAWSASTMEDSALPSRLFAGSWSAGEHGSYQYRTWDQGSQQLSYPDGKAWRTAGGSADVLR